MSESRRLGRPSKSDSEKRQQIGVRTSPELKALLENAASVNGRSVAQESELRLLESFKDEDRSGGKRTHSVMRLLAALANDVQLRMGKAWFDDYAAWCAYRELINHVLETHSPAIPNNRALRSALAREAVAKKDLENMTNVLQKLSLERAHATAKSNAIEAAGPAIEAREVGQYTATQLKNARQI